jgi:ubiquinol-cytochrome c reductase cytochrome c1 subunit
MKRALILLLGLVASAPAFSAGAPALLSYDADPGNRASLQRGARNFMNYCAGCHSLKFLRYNRLARDLGIPEELVESHLMFTSDPADTIHSPMLSAIPATSEDWFGQEPPDLSLTTRLRGANWVYSFLNTFYVDAAKPTGVDNLQLPGASMPHVLWSLQGWQELVEKGDGRKVAPKFELVRPGELSPQEYRAFTADLTNFMIYAAEPGRADRISMGWKVMLYLLVLWGLAYLLKREYWKDVH